MSYKAWWYIFRVSDQGQRVEVVAGPFQYHRHALANLPAMTPPPAGAQLVIDSVHYDRTRLAGRGVGAQLENAQAAIKS